RRVEDVREVEQPAFAEPLPLVLDHVRRVANVDLPHEAPAHDLVRVAVDVLGPIIRPVQRAELETRCPSLELHAPLLAIALQVEARVHPFALQAVVPPAGPIGLLLASGAGGALTDRAQVDERLSVEEVAFVARAAPDEAAGRRIAGSVVLEARIAGHRTP